MEFTYPSSTLDPNDDMIIVRDSTRGKSNFGDRVLRLIDPDPVKGTSQNSTGRAYYAQPFQLWDRRTNIVTDFTTSFDFAILFSEQQYNFKFGFWWYGLVYNFRKVADYSYKFWWRMVGAIQ
ncbi:hypothetical protein CRYUN_Cryun18bG0085900 [Craigia yunnanensis]